MKSKAIIPLALGLAVGVVAIKFSMDAVRKARGSTSGGELLTAVVAASDIPASARITAEMIRLVKTPKTALLPPDMFKSAKDVEGRVVSKSVPQGAPILPSVVAPPGTPEGLMSLVPEGCRACSVEIKEWSAVAYLVRPFDYVDVVSVAPAGSGRNKEMVSRVILQNVQVLAVGQITGDGRDETNKNAKSVTLAIKVDDVPKLNLATTKGRMVSLALRGVLDTVVTKPAQASENDVFGDKSSKTGAQGAGSFLSGLFASWTKAAQTSPTPAPPAQPSTWSVTVANTSAAAGRGGQVQQVTYRSSDSLEVVQTDGRGAVRGPTANPQPMDELGPGNGGEPPPPADPQVDTENETDSGSSEVNKE